MEPQSIDERRDKGIAWLDAKQPGWRDKIDPKLLDMARCQECIFGQLYGYWGNRPVDMQDRDTLVAMGFNVSGTLTDYEVETEFRLLTESWLRELE